MTHTDSRPGAVATTRWRPRKMAQSACQYSILRSTGDGLLQVYYSARSPRCRERLVTQACPCGSHVAIDCGTLDGAVVRAVQLTERFHRTKKMHGS